jgi:hypothetical protein
MNARDLAFVPILALVAVGISVWTGDSTLAAFTAGLAGLLAGAFLIALLVDRIHWDLPPTPVLEGDPLMLLARAFRAGRFGRVTILARLNGLESVGSTDPSARAREEERMLTAPNEEFLRYVEQRIAEVEGRT